MSSPRKKAPKKVHDYIVTRCCSKCSGHRIHRHDCHLCMYRIEKRRRGKLQA